jgi:hypothetical protein
MTGSPLGEIGANATGFLTQESDGFRFLAVKNALLPLDGQKFDSPENALRAIAASLFLEPPFFSDTGFLSAPLRTQPSHSLSAPLEKTEK